MTAFSSVSLAEVKRFAFGAGLAFCFTPTVTPKEHLIACAKALCEANGGPDAVADAAGISAESLKQVLAGTKLPSGQPRGVGPKLQRQLEVAFPGWSRLPTAGDLAARAAWPLRRLSALQWAALDSYTKAAMEEAAIAKMKELQAERSQSGGASTEPAHRDRKAKLSA